MAVVRRLVFDKEVGANDLADYRNYCLFLGGIAVLFALVAFATFDAVFDD